MTNFCTIYAQKFPQTLVLKNYTSYLVHKTSTTGEQVLEVCVEAIE
jgi:hypothetical protein